MLLSKYHRNVSMNGSTRDIKHRMWKFFVDATYDSGCVGFIRFYFTFYSCVCTAFLFCVFL